jgi:hypothetical protein
LRSTKRESPSSIANREGAAKGGSRSFVIGVGTKFASLKVAMMHIADIWFL